MATIIGVDEVGRGPLAGPVLAVALVLGKNMALKGWLTQKHSVKKNARF